MHPGELSQPKATSTTRLRAVDPENAVTCARLTLGLTQEAFAQLLDTPVGTVRGWEQGRRQPPACAKVLLRVAMHFPETVLKCSNAEMDTPLPPKTPKKPKAARRKKQPTEVAAHLHQSGEEADFWLL